MKDLQTIFRALDKILEKKIITSHSYKIMVDFAFFCFKKKENPSIFFFFFLKRLNYNDCDHINFFFEKIIDFFAEDKNKNELKFSFFDKNTLYYFTNFLIHLNEG